MPDHGPPDDPDDALFDDLEQAESQPLAPADTTPRPTRSHYALTRKEIIQGLANRFVHSRAYIFFYLGMAALCVATVVLSLGKGCPGLPFYILEVIINSAMILEVGVRFVAFGKQFWRSPFNVVDLILTFFCMVTLVAITLVGCGSASKAEEVFDTLLLGARNVLQFGRLAAVMRQSGQSIFTGPKPIDLSSAGRSRRLDIDIEDNDDEDYQRISNGISLGYSESETPQDEVVFDAEAHAGGNLDPWREPYLDSSGPNR